MSSRARSITLLHHRIVVYVVVTLFFAGSAGVFGYFLWNVPHPIRWGVLLFVTAIIGGCYYTTMREMVTRVTVGADGVFVKELNRRRFLPFSAIAEVNEEPDRVTLVLRPGGRERITTNRTRHAFRKAHVARLDAILDAIRRGVADHAPALATATGTSALVAHARALLTSGAGAGDVYREAALPDRAALQALIADAGAPLPSRAAAAVLLRDEPDVRARLSTIAAETASPSLAALFTAVAAQRDESALAATLDEVGTDDYEAPISGGT